MSKIKEATNPFYAVLLVMGLVFVVTACAYGVMMVQTLQQGGPPPSAMVTWLEANGTWLLAGETVILAVLTFGAIGTDGYWTQKSDEPNSEEQNPPGDD